MCVCVCVCVCVYVCMYVAGMGKKRNEHTICRTTCRKEVS